MPFRPFRSIFVIVLAFLVKGVPSMSDSPAEYISDLADERIVSQVQAFGTLGMDTAVVPPDGRAAMPLRIKDSTFEKGLGSHAPGEIVIDLGGGYAAFEAEVGVQWQNGQAGSVVFQVFVDDEKKFESGVLKETDGPQSIHVACEMAETLRLVATDAGDGITCDCANWAGARLIRSTNPKALSAIDPFEAAPFGQVSTWDPKRMDGARCDRVQEFSQEDIFLDKPVKLTDGFYEVPRYDDWAGCLGLSWPERREVREARLVFAEGVVPSASGAEFQYWKGESPWQGEWRKLNAEIETIIEGEPGWVVRVLRRGNPDFPPLGTEKIRWILPPSKTPVRVRSLHAFTRSRWDTVELRIQTEKGAYEETGTITVLNGYILSPKGDASMMGWDLGEALNVKVRYAKPRSLKYDRTTLLLSRQRGDCGVSVESVLASGSVYVKDLGVMVSLASDPRTLDAVRESLSGKKTILERVREMPDQTFEQAMEHVHNPLQDLGPMMLSLACDNQKFVAHREGMVEFNLAPDDPNKAWGSWKVGCRMVPQFGTGEIHEVARHLEGAWLPIPVTTLKSGEVTYTQKTFVAPFGQPVSKSPWLWDKTLCVVEWTLDNASDSPREASLDLRFSIEEKPLQVASSEMGFSVAVDGRPVVFLNTAGLQAFQADTQPDGLILKGTLPPNTKAVCAAFIPSWQAESKEPLPPIEIEDLAEKTASYWKQVLSAAAQIDLPDPFLTDVIRASQVHCLLAARHDPSDQTVAAWIASDRYGPLESEAHSVVLGMDRMGHSEYAQSALDYFIKKYNPQGYLTTGYTMMGTGWHLWTLAEHFALTRDLDWFKGVAPEVERVCRWIEAQREKTKRLDPESVRYPEYGLMPPGVVADWNRFAYRFALQAHYYAGLHDAAAALDSIARPEGERLLGAAAEFQKEVERAYRWQQARNPAVPLQNGAWIPASPSILFCFGPTAEAYPGEDGNRSWCYDVEIGAHHLAAAGALDPKGPEAGWMLDYLEDEQCLSSGMGEYTKEKNRADWFNLGGFTKVQPYYARMVDVYAARDEVKPFIRSYFNAIPSLLSRENLSFWEHFHNIGGWNKTHETGWFLAQTRTMLVHERENELWLAPFVTNNWLKDGMVVSVQNAPTRFGPVSYRLASSAAQGFIEAEIDVPNRLPPKLLVLRVRHPHGKPIREAQVKGGLWNEVDAALEIIRIRGAEGRIHIRVDY